MIECPNCGGNMKFDIPTQNLLCAFCETQIDPQEYQDSKDEKVYENDLVKVFKEYFAFV